MIAESDLFIRTHACARSREGSVAGVAGSHPAGAQKSWPAWIRTMTRGTKNPCATVTPRASLRLGQRDRDRTNRLHRQPRLYARDPSASGGRNLCPPAPRDAREWTARGPLQVPSTQPRPRSDATLRRQTLATAAKTSPRTGPSISRDGRTHVRASPASEWMAGSVANGPAGEKPGHCNVARTIHQTGPHNPRMEAASPSGASP